MSVAQKDFWDHVYKTQDPSELSWYQPVAAKSMALIRASEVPVEAPIIDVGGGVSALVEILLNSDYSDVTVLDISEEALAQTRQRLGETEDKVKWIVADMLEFEPLRRYYLWHDRATFHFLVDNESIGKYVAVLRTALIPKGHFVLSTFGPDGPDRCSGFDVQRYSIETLTRLLEAYFELQAFELEEHATPTGTTQQFLLSHWQARE